MFFPLFSENFKNKEGSISLIHDESQNEFFYDLEINTFRKGDGVLLTK